LKKIFSILLSLALVVSLSLATAAPVMAVELPSISPTTGVYDLDNPGHVEFNIDFGDATHLDGIEDDNGTLAANTTTTYVQFEQLVVISEAYLDSVFTCVDEEWIFQVNFEPFGTAFLTVTCIGTAPSLQESSADWDYWLGGDVVVGMDLNIAGSVSDVEDAGGSIGGANWVDGGTTLTIKDAYIENEIGAGGGGVIGDDVELTVTFDSCYVDLLTIPTDYHTATLTIEAAGVTVPRLAPTSATYDKCNPGDLEFTITWDGAANVDSVQDVTIMGPGYPSPLTVTTHYTVAGDILTIKNAWMAPRFAISATKVLEVNFDDAGDTDVSLVINAAWVDQPFMGVTSNVYTYDLDTYAGNLGALGTGSLVNFGCATNVTGVHDMTDDIELTTAYPYTSGQYTTLYIPGYGYLCVILYTYLPLHLTYLGDSMELSVAFDKGDNATWYINAVGTQPSISPTSAEFNLDDPADVTTDVTLGPHASSFTITGLTLDVDYTVSGDTVSINATYLSSVLAAVDDVTVLTFVFDEGDNANLTITAVGTPLCLIATAAGADAPELDILREFRDVVLRPNSLGAKLVSLYYEASPPIAELISENEALRTAVKVCLIDPIVAILSWSQCLWS
jgi:hypothetical protein